MIDNTAFFKFSYGLYLIITSDGARDNGMVSNSAVQVTDDPKRVAVTINKASHTLGTALATQKLNVAVLDESAPFSLFENFGFRSGRDADKFAGVEFTRSENGLAVPSKHCSAFVSLKVEQHVDLGTHVMLVCTVTEARKLSDAPSMTYSYYQANVKPKPGAQPKKGWVCTVCGYVYEGDELPPDFICPVCGRPASDFERTE